MYSDQIDRILGEVENKQTWYYKLYTVNIGIGGLGTLSAMIISILKLFSVQKEMLIVVIFLIVWFLLNNRHVNGDFVSRSFFDSILIKFIKRKNKTDLAKQYNPFLITKENFMEAIMVLGYENIVDNLIVENESILNRKSAQDSDRFSLFFNAVFITILGALLSNMKVIKIFLDYINKFINVSPILLLWLCVLILLWFNCSNFLHELGRDYQNHLLLNAALYQIKNEYILNCSEKINTNRKRY